MVCIYFDSGTIKWMLKKNSSNYPRKYKKECTICHLAKIKRLESPSEIGCCHSHKPGPEKSFTDKHKRRHVPWRTCWKWKRAWGKMWRGSWRRKQKAAVRTATSTAAQELVRREGRGRELAGRSQTWGRRAGPGHCSPRPLALTILKTKWVKQDMW